MEEWTPVKWIRRFLMTVELYVCSLRVLLHAGKNLGSFLMSSLDSYSTGVSRGRQQPLWDESPVSWSLRCFVLVLAPILGFLGWPLRISYDDNSLRILQCWCLWSELPVSWSADFVSNSCSNFSRERRIWLLPAHILDISPWLFFSLFVSPGVWFGCLGFAIFFTRNDGLDLSSDAFLIKITRSRIKLLV